MTEDGGGPPRAADTLTGHWRVSIPPQNLSAAFDLRLDGTVVTGIYQVDGSTAGSFRGTLAGRHPAPAADRRPGRLRQHLGRHGRQRRSDHWHWTANELVTGQPTSREWTAVRESGQ